jgi:TRAP transporter TAXI family solute receptor
MLRSGELDFALVQSDWQMAAFEGRAPFAASGAMDDLRTVMPLYPESVTILAAPGSGIRTSIDLAGRTVDIGRPASGRNATVLSLVERLGMDESFFGEVRYLEPSDAIDELCAGHIDAAVFVVGHPSGLVREALGACDATIAAFSGPRISEILAESADYQRSVVDPGLYDLPGEPVETISVMATLVTRAAMEPALVADIVTAIRTETDTMAAALPVLGAFGQPLETPVGTVVPMHPAAAGAD